MAKYKKKTKAAEPETPQEGYFFSDTRDDLAEPDGRLRPTPEKIARLLREADTGEMGEYMELVGYVEEDAHVAAVLGKRYRAVECREIEIKPWVPTKDATPTEQAQRAADLCRRVVFGDENVGGIENWAEAINDLLHAIHRGYALSQIVWRKEGSLYLIDSLERWPSEHVRIGNSVERQTQSGDELRISTIDNMIPGELPEPGHWVVHTHKQRSDALCRASLSRVVVWYWMFKRFSFRDWVIFAERYGMPLRIGKYDKMHDDTERAMVKKAVQQLGKDGGATLPVGAMIEFIETKSTGEGPYKFLIDSTNAEISKAVLGATLTTEVGSTGGNRALGEVQKSAEYEATASDASKLSRTLRRDLLRWIVKFNLGAGFPTPFIEFCSDDRDEKAELEVDQGLQAMGFEFSAEYLSSKYKRPLIKEGETPIRTAPAAPNNAQN